MPFNSISDWTDNFGPNNVQNDEIDVGTGTNFVSAESVIVAAGFPSYAEADISNMIPIGLVENATIQQNKQLQQLFEIGSRRPFFIPGRHQISATLSRVLFNGPSLMKALYRLRNTDVGTTAATISDIQGEELRGSVASDDLPAAGFTGTSDGDSLYINLASEFFNNPFGLGLFIRNQKGDGYGGVYLEECFIQAHQLSIAAQQTVLLENCSLRSTAVHGVSTDSWSA